MKRGGLCQALNRLIEFQVPQVSLPDGWDEMISAVKDFVFRAEQFALACRRTGVGDELTRRATLFRKGTKKGSKFRGLLKDGFRSCNRILGLLLAANDVALTRPKRDAYAVILEKYHVLEEWLDTLPEEQSGRWKPLLQPCFFTLNGLGIWRGAFLCIPRTVEAITQLLADSDFANVAADSFPYPPLDSVARALREFDDDVTRRSLYGCFLLDACYQDPLRAADDFLWLLWTENPLLFGRQVAAMQTAAKMLESVHSSDDEDGKEEWWHSGGKVPEEYERNEPVTGNLTDLAWQLEPILGTKDQRQFKVWAEAGDIWARRLGTSQTWHIYFRDPRMASEARVLLEKHRSDSEWWHPSEEAVPDDYKRSGELQATKSELAKAWKEWFSGKHHWEQLKSWNKEGVVWVTPHGKARLWRVYFKDPVKANEAREMLEQYRLDQEPLRKSKKQQKHAPSVAG